MTIRFISFRIACIKFRKETQLKLKSEHSHTKYGEVTAYWITHLVQAFEGRACAHTQRLWCANLELASVLFETANKVAASKRFQIETASFLTVDITGHLR